MTGEVAATGTLVRVDELGGMENTRVVRVAGKLESVVIRFAGDSGDGMQLTGSQFATTSALIGNDIATMPDFPAEIRAPAGTLPGVSSFQLQFASGEIFTPGDEPDVLVAMNAAALKVNLGTLRLGRTIIANTDGFDAGNLSKSGYAANPLDDGSLDGYRVIPIPLTTLTMKVLEESPLPSATSRCRRTSMRWECSTGSTLTAMDGDTEPRWIKQKFAKSPDVVRSQPAGARGGYAYADGRRAVRRTAYEVPRSSDAAWQLPQHHRQHGAALGLVRGRAEGRAAAFLGTLPDHARPPTSCTSSRRHEGLRR
ncbi:MAG: 2-oxoacid:acceptor oxidoreductase family protein [Bryobacterales bacterium]|nr:2-oxoacid:acceptor oxidoreductase family protein [Bryobacterales bacterium]